MRRKLAHGQILDNAPLDLLQTVMILVEDPARLRDVDWSSLGKLPRQLDEPVQIGAHHPVFGSRLRHALQPSQLLARLLLHLFRHAGIGDRSVEPGNLR